MNLILLFESDFIDEGKVRLRGRRLKHVIEVHRAREGDSLCVGLVNGGVGRGLVTALSRESLEMTVVMDGRPPEKLPVTLLLALPRPKVLRRVLQAVTSMGVREIYLINSWRVEKSYWQTPFLAPEKIREQVVLGLEQAKDTVLPPVHLKKYFKAFVEDQLPEIAGNTRKLVAHPVGESPCPQGSPVPTTLAIGPEGGFIPYEIEKLQAAGFSPVTMGERILKVETAVPALLSKLF